jgi:hypothetical protein
MVASDLIVSYKCDAIAKIQGNILYKVIDVSSLLDTSYLPSNFSQGQAFGASLP